MDEVFATANSWLGNVGAEQSNYSQQSKAQVSSCADMKDSSVRMQLDDGSELVLSPGDLLRLSRALNVVNGVGQEESAADPYSFSLQISVGLTFWMGLFISIFGFVLWCHVSKAPSRYFAGQVRRFEDWVIEFSTRFLVEVMTDEEVKESASSMLADGINAWLTNTKTPEHLSKFYTESKPETTAAYELGQSTPKLLRGFVEGLVNSILYKAARLVYEDARCINKAVGFKTTFVPHAS